MWLLLLWSTLCGPKHLVRFWWNVSSGHLWHIHTYSRCRLLSSQVANRCRWIVGYLKVWLNWLSWNNICILYPYRDMKLYILLELYRYCYVVIYHIEVVAPGFKGMPYSKVMSFLNSPDSSTCSNTCSTHLVIISTLLTTIKNIKYQ